MSLKSYGLPKIQLFRLFVVVFFSSHVVSCCWLLCCHTIVIASIGVVLLLHCVLCLVSCWLLCVVCWCYCCCLCSSCCFLVFLHCVFCCLLRCVVDVRRFYNQIVVQLRRIISTQFWLLPAMLASLFLVHFSRGPTQTVITEVPGWQADHSVRIQ